jgi:5-methyltetrahydropteroyltriglutamate--homocysteine methyltransferase
MDTLAIETAVVGSYPQPDWLVDKARYRDTVVPRMRMPELWRVPAPYLEEAQDDAVRVAVSDMDAAGVDVVTDGEQRRESYFNQFANALAGIDVDRPGEAINRLGKRQAVPRVTSAIRRERPIFLRDAQFLRAITRRRIKLAVPGPFTLSALAQDEHYRDPERLAMAYAAAVNEELRDLEPLLDWIQLDEPYLEARPDQAKAYALSVIDRALAGLRKPTCVHVCFGYAFSHALAGTSKSGGYRFALELERSAATHLSLEAAQPRLDLASLGAIRTKTIVLGVLDLGAPQPETADVVAARLRAALRHIPSERLVAAPDCGMKYLDRTSARLRLGALTEGARTV